MKMKKTECPTCNRVFNSVDDYLKGTKRFRVCTQGHLWFECSCKSGMILEKGDFEWYSPDMRMSSPAKSIFSDIAGIDRLPQMNSAVLQLQSLIADPNSTTVAIKRALKKLPTIAINLVKTADLLSGKVSNGVKNIEHAITYMGRDFISKLVLKEAISEFEFKSQKYTRDLFWQEAIITGKVCESLTLKLQTNLGWDEAYIAGSLANIGKIVQAICYPEKVDQIYELTNGNAPMSWVEAEKKVNIHSHAVLGEIAAAIWGFPEDLIQVIGNHHCKHDDVRQLVQNIDFFDEIVADLNGGDKEAVGSKSPDLQQLVFLGNQLTHWILLHPHRMQPQVFEDYCKFLEINDKKVDDIVQSLLFLRESSAA